MLSRKSDQKTFKCDLQFWDHPEKWPHDPIGYVFLARAFHEIGRAIYGDRWVESPSDLEPEEPDDDCDDVTEDHYERDCKLAEAEFQNMRVSVVRKIAEQCEAGTLVTALRPSPGGEMVTLKKHLWNTENFWSRFTRCEMSRKYPFSNNVGGVQQQSWIFITQDSFDRYRASHLIPGSARQLSTADQCSDPALGLSDAALVGIKTNTTKRRSGRTPGSGSWNTADEPLLQKMHRLIEEGSAKSPHDAAGQLAENAKGAGTVDSKQSRLEKAYRKQFSAGEK